jgi:hypothetical protein
MNRRTRYFHGFLVSGASLLALMCAASPGWAQCAPDPTVSGGTTICSGVDVDGLLVTTPNTRVIVNADADVRGGGEGWSIIASNVEIQTAPRARTAINVLGRLSDGLLVRPG